ncbi:MAG TPA: aldo/keto reductase [Candidatus Lokiarchaeia archaeon]|nr:aldo/keto reductase [Candidatus Lokiarchaeia archaeon]
MQYRKFGSLDWEVSALGFGCMRLPTRKVLFWKSIDVPEAVRIIRHAIDAGVNYVDTAFGYHGGKSEIVVGKALQDGYRAKVCLATKLPMWRVKKTEDFDFYLGKQLQRLQTDHIDFYLFHGLNQEHFKKVKDLNLFQKMEEARDSGRIKHICFSFHDSFAAFKEIIDAFPWDMAQVQYNYLDQNTQATTAGLEYAASKGIAVVVMEPIKGGVLASPIPEVQSLFESADVKRKPADWALQFVWNHPEVLCVLSGMGSMQMVEDNLASAETSGANSLTPGELDTIGQALTLYQGKILIPCGGCQYCQPCPQGVQIPSIFNAINEYAKSGNKRVANMMFKRILKENGGPDRCASCNQCAELCPQQIDIPLQLSKAKRVIGGESLKAVFEGN